MQLLASSVIQNRLSLILSTVFCIFACCYAFLFWQVFSDTWFHPQITSDDARQQVFLFHRVLEPELFEQDLIYEGMRGYLTPAHWGMGTLLTYLTGDAIVAGHWISAIQLFLSLVFLFLAVRKLASIPAACFSVVWFLHTRSIFDRMAGGLPRGWTCVVLCAFLWCLVEKKHGLILVLLVLGCLTHPPATMIAATTYGLFLVYSVARDRSNWRYLRNLIIISPLCIALTSAVIRRPPSIGSMITEADGHPAFSRTGRFPFLPFRPVDRELSHFAEEPFFGDSTNPLLKRVFRLVLPVIFLSALFFARKAIPGFLYVYLLVILGLYLLSRQMAFSLYVPDRYIREPLALFYFVAFPVALWHAAPRSLSLRSAGHAAFASFILAGSLFWFFYPRALSPGNFNSYFYAIGADGWVQTGSEVRLPALASLQGSVALHFDAWRPDGVAETEIAWSVCDGPQQIARVSYKHPVVKIPVGGDCQPRTISLDPQNPFQVPGDQRQLGVKLNKLYLPLPLVSFQYVSLLALALPLLLLARAKGVRTPLSGALQLAVFTLVIFSLSGSGLSPNRSFVINPTARGGFVMWLRDNTAKSDLIAGHPTHLDEVPLFAKRKAYLTTETAHPFYKGYFKKVSERMEKFFRAYYASDINELAAFLEQEGVDYFVFRHADFEKPARYHSPFRELVRELSARKNTAFKEIDPSSPFVVFRDERSTIIQASALLASLG